MIVGAATVGNSVSLVEAPRLVPRHTSHTALEASLLTNEYRRPRTNRVALLVRSATFLLSMTACEGSIQAPRERAGTVDVRPYVTPQVLASLGPDGTFSTEAAAPEPFDQITPEAAQAQAVAALKAFGPGLRGYLEEGHGGPIDFSAVVPTRVYYATSAYDQTIPPEFNLAMRKLAGPYYMVVLSSSEEAPVVSVAVSAYNTDIGVQAGQLVYRNTEEGHAFRLKGIKATDDGLPLPPERAVQIASSAAGVRVAGSPRLQLSTVRQIPQAAWWRVPLERSVRVHDADSGKDVEASELLVGPDRRAAAGIAASAPRTDRLTDPITHRTFDAPVRTWIPVGVAPVTPQTLR